METKRNGKGNGEPLDIESLLNAAARCPNRYQCPPWDSLLTLAEQPGDTVLLSVLGEKMKNLEINPHRGIGPLIPRLLSAWLQYQGEGLTAVQQNTLEALMMEAARSSANYRQEAYRALGWIRSEEVMDFLIGEVQNEANRSPESREAAAEVLGSMLKTLELPRKWLNSSDVWLKEMAVVLIDQMDFSSNQEALQQADELLKGTALSPATEKEVILRVLNLLILIDEPEFKPVFQKLQAHPDPDVRLLARKGLE
ncbi:MAG: hypothetical protein H6558_12200 [Lewinellaceae bacterium]|nr:hypothetical protein [Phaeodactylibacter sp.]MCB9265779.1 hypothetical protein [Lewinellaceae bacterium]MCB9352578.1 hypothetical protein [Lewinellaceae bacterium]